jgi:glucosamine--fructose-6-phosphate aminotransferase (isomerizing)
MCGIIGLVNGNSVVPDLMAGLRRLEYRGYDSSGIAVVRDRLLEKRRAQGKLDNLEKVLGSSPVDGRNGIAHTRWATHGAPTADNAHPHATERVAVVHNGIIENFRELRAELQAAGHGFSSQTDTEVIPHLITHYLDEGMSEEGAMQATLGRLRGSYALGVLFAGDDSRLIAARRGSPLVLGHGDSATHLASDALALGGQANELTYLDEGDWAVIEQRRAEVRDADGRRVRRARRPAGQVAAAVGKGAYRHYMEKEIHEQPQVIRHTLARYIDAESGRVRLPEMPFDLAGLTRLTIVACGTSHYSGTVARYWFEQLAGLPVDVDIASEFRYRESPLQPGGAALFISQSGETADTLAALRYARAQGQHIVAVVNVEESSMAREADVVLPTLAGPEIGVASTKAFTTQLTVLASLALAIAEARGRLDDIEAAQLAEVLRSVPTLMERLLGDLDHYPHVAREFANATSALFIGRGPAYPIALEGALKLKEISYIHAEGFGAGELKHGPIALVDADTPVVVIAPFDELFEKTVSNLQEVRARGGRVVLVSDATGLAHAGEDACATLEIPDAAPLAQPLLTVLPLQLLAYHVATQRGTDVDQPRNLAKSVTVE